MGEQSLPVTRLSFNFENIKIDEEKYDILYHDIWLYYQNINNFEEYESEVNFNAHRVDDKLKDIFIASVMKGFSGDNPNDPYEALSDGYRVALYKSFDSNSSQYKVQHYLGMYINEPICTATVVYKDNIALVYNVTTNKEYQRKGVCKSMMSKIMRDLVTLEIDTVALQTEKGFYTEDLYKNMGFKEILNGIAYGEKADISAITKTISKLIEDTRKTIMKTIDINDVEDPTIINFLGLEKYLNKIPIKINELIQEIEIPTNEMDVLYNRETGEYIHILNEDMQKVDYTEDFEKLLNEALPWEKENYKVINDILKDKKDKYVYLPSSRERDDANIIQEFIKTIDDRKISEELYSYLYKKGMYRKIKDKLLEHGITDKYDKFYRESLKELAIDWCERNAFKYE